MNKFNLTFRGEIQPDRDPQEVKARFGKLFSIDDPARVEKFFSGDTIILRRNLDRKTAAEYFAKLRKLGVASELVKVDDDQPAAGETTAPPQKTKTAPSSSPKPEEKISPAKPFPVSEQLPENLSGQRWAVRSSKDSSPATDKQVGKEPAAAKRKAAGEAARRKAEAENQRKAEEEAARRKAEAEKQRQAEQEANRRKAEAEKQRQAEEEATRRKAEAEKQRQAEEEATRRKAEAEKQRKAEEEAARRKAEAEKQRKAEEEAARRKAEAEKQRKAEEEAARRKAEAEKQRKAEEEAARRKAEAEKQRKAEEEAARRKAEAEKQRKAEEEAARRKAEAEKQRKAEEEAARRKAEAEKQRKAEEEAARRKAEAEKQRKAEEEAARRKAEAEKQRKAEEEAARRKAEAEKQRKAEEEAARRKAEAEKQRRAAEEAARRKAEAEAEQQRKAAEDAARRKAEAEQQSKAAEAAAQRKAVQEAQRQEAAKRNRAAREAQALQLAEREIEDQRRRLAENKAAQLKSEQENAQGKKPAPLKERSLKQAAKAKSLEEQAVASAGAKLAQQPTLKPVQARIKTKLEVPGKQKTRQEGILHERRRRRRQPGEPNFYQLRPFRVTPLIRNRAQLSRRKSRQGFMLAGLALTGLFALAAGYLAMPAPPTTQGPEAMAAVPGSGPILLAADRLLLHDRSGAGSAELGLQSLGLTSLLPPIAVSTEGELFARGLRTQSSAEQSVSLMRCQLTQAQCQDFSEELTGRALPAFAVHPLHGSVFLVDSSAGELLKLDKQGKLLARAPIDVPYQPVIRLESGLLFMNSPAAPAISVFRPDDDGFGRQLDEILLLPPEAVAAAQTRVANFTWSGENWWVALQNPETGDTGLYRFDLRWTYIARVPLPPGATPELLLNWGGKTLVADSSHLAIERFNALGEPEAPLVSDLLKSLISQQKKIAGLTQLAWIGALLICLISALTGLYLGVLHRQRWLVYKPGGERGAEPVDSLLDSARWINTLDKRTVQLRRTIFSYALLATALLLFAISRNVSVLQLLALLIASLGPLITLLLLSRTTAGSIGVAGRQLLLADHAHMYHIGSGPEIKYRGPFLLLDDVVVFTGTALLPAFSREQVVSTVRPEASRGIRVDRRTVAIKLLESHHPLAVGAIASAICLATAVVLLYLNSAG